MAQSKIVRDATIQFTNITVANVASQTNAKLVRKIFEVTTNGSGNAEINITYHHVLKVDVLGSSYYVFMRKNGTSGNNNLVINIKDMALTNLIDTTIQVLVTYLDY